MIARIALCTLNVLLVFNFSQAQTFEEVLRKQSDDIADVDNFGGAMDIDGNYAIIGAEKEDEDSSGSNTLSTAGSAYILKKDEGGTNNWGQLVKLVAPDRASKDRFGSSVAISGDWAVVGAHNHDLDSNGNNSVSNAGAAYIFKKDQGGSDKWGFVKKITAPDRGIKDNFGESVDISGDYIIAAADGQDFSDTSGSNQKIDAGAVYLYKKDNGGNNNWGLFKKLVAYDRADNDLYGYSVAISGDLVVVGTAFQDYDLSTNIINDAGAAYVYEKDKGGTDNWGLQKKIIASDRTVDDVLGWSVAISDSTIVLGAPGQDSSENGANYLSLAGAAYIFQKNYGGTDNWGQVKKLVASDRTASDEYGESVHISGSYLVVGSREQDSSATGTDYLASAGAVYVYHQNHGGTNQWGQVQKLVASDRAASDKFGEAVAISDDFVFVSTIADSGSVHIFDQKCSSSDSLPTAADSTYTARYSQTDAQGWTHYCTFNQELLLSLKLGLSGAEVDPEQVRLKIGASKAFSSNDSGGMIFNPDGYTIIDRRWDVNATSQPATDSTVGVKYYFTKDEYDALKDSLLNHGGGSTKSTLSAVTDINLFKASSGSAFADPHTVNGTVILNGSTASDSVWVHSTHGSVDHTAEFKVTSFSGGGGGGGAGGGSGTAPLPVELIDFTARAISQEEVLVNWITASEINHSHFELERSFDGRFFEKVHQEAGSGFSNELKRYAYIDNQIPKSTEVIYYRLLQFDLDGTSTSRVKKVKLNSENQFAKVNVAPNPFNGKVILVLENLNETETKIRILDIQGKQHFAEHMSSYETYPSHELDLRFLSDGTYVLEIINGHWTQRRMIIKK